MVSLGTWHIGFPKNGIYGTQNSSLSCYSDTEFKFVESKKKIGTRKKGYKNNTNYDFTIIDSVWNNIIVRKEGFNVSGHLRLQPCGIQSMDRKLIWITEHKKHGYVRGLKKIL